MEKHIIKLFLLSSVVLLFCACGGKTEITVDETDAQSVRIVVKNPSRYLLLPIESGQPACRSVMAWGENEILLGRIRLAREKADHVVPILMPEGVGEVVIRVDSIQKGAYALNHLEAADVFQSEKKQEGAGFLPQWGFLTQPAAAVVKDGRFHVFYEWNPYGYESGNAHWGHAESSDLQNWEEKAVAFGPDSIGEALGGSIVIDRFNIFGAGKEAMIAVYSASRGEGEARRQEMCLAYSKTGGETFEKFVTNPVLRTYDDIPTFRHPRVFRYKKGNIWEMVVSCGDEIRVYSSEDLGNWNLESRQHYPFDGTSASDFKELVSAQIVEVPTEGGETEWVLLCNELLNDGSDQVKAFVGKFAGKEFTPLQTIIQQGGNVACLLAFDGTEGRCLLTGIQKGTTNSLALPVELSLKKTGSGWQAQTKLARELEGKISSEGNAGWFRIEQK